MQEYYQGLLYLKRFLLGGEVAILLFRLFFQQLFSLTSTFLILQTFLASLIMCRRVCMVQAQLYIVVSCIIFYSLIYNQVQFITNKNPSSSPLFENFREKYKIWGYAIEGIFQIIGIVIAWRSYQFSKTFEDDELYDNF